MKIQKAKKSDLKILNKELLAKNMPWLHDMKLKEQEKGNSFWIIAWKNKKPIAHIQIKIKGSISPDLKGKLRRCPHLETLFVVEKYRRKGIAKELMIFCENFVRKKGYLRCGLAVEKHESFLIKFYKRIGYEDWGKGIVREPWKKLSGDKIIKNNSKCKYLIKKLK